MEEIYIQICGKKKKKKKKNEKTDKTEESFAAVGLSKVG